MKNKTRILAIILVLILIPVLLSCSQQKPQETVYTVSVYKVYTDSSMALGYLANKLNMDKNILIRKILEGETKLDPNKVFEIDTYTAKEIITFSDTSIRFIDNTGKEQFISADYIEVIAQ